MHDKVNFLNDKKYNMHQKYGNSLKILNTFNIFQVFYHWKNKVHQHISCYWSLSIPPEKIRKPLVFWCFREYKKRPVVRNRLNSFPKKQLLTVFYMVYFLKGCGLVTEIKIYSTTNVILWMSSFPDQILPF